MKRSLIHWLGLTSIAALFSYAAAGVNAVLGWYLFNGFQSITGRSM